jgi:hypothetical protein
VPLATLPVCVQSSGPVLTRATCWLHCRVVEEAAASSPVTSGSSSGAFTISITPASPRPSPPEGTQPQTSDVSSSGASLVKTVLPAVVAAAVVAALAGLGYKIHQRRRLHRVVSFDSARRQAHGRGLAKAWPSFKAAFTDIVRSNAVDYEAVGSEVESRADSYSSGGPRSPAVFDTSGFGEAGTALVEIRSGSATKGAKGAKSSSIQMTSITPGGVVVVAAVSSPLAGSSPRRASSLAPPGSGMERAGSVPSLGDEELGSPAGRVGSAARLLGGPGAGSPGSRPWLM